MFQTNFYSKQHTFPVVKGKTFADKIILTNYVRISESIQVSKMFAPFPRTNFMRKTNCKKTLIVKQIK